MLRTQTSAESKNLDESLQGGGHHFQAGYLPDSREELHGGTGQPTGAKAHAQHSDHADSPPEVEPQDAHL